MSSTRTGWVQYVHWGGGGGGKLKFSITGKDRCYYEYGFDQQGWYGTTNIPYQPCWSNPYSAYSPTQKNSFSKTSLPLLLRPVPRQCAKKRTRKNKPNVLKLTWSDNGVLELFHSCCHSETFGKFLLYTALSNTSWPFYYDREKHRSTWHRR